MVKSYFLLYKKAKQLYDENKIQLEGIKGDTYYFKINNHLITLSHTKQGNHWKRNYECDCESYALFQEKNPCKHLLAAQYYLTNGGGAIGKETTE